MRRSTAVWRPKRHNHHFAYRGPSQVRRRANRRPPQTVITGPISGNAVPNPDPDCAGADFGERRAITPRSTLLRHPRTQHHRAKRTSTNNGTRCRVVRPPVGRRVLRAASRPKHTQVRMRECRSAVSDAHATAATAAIKVRFEPGRNAPSSVVRLHRPPKELNRTISTISR